LKFLGGIDMKKSNHTLRALVASILSLTVFSAMFIGSTYAWFTDTATTGVNSIQSGTLDVELLYEDNTTAEGATLNFLAADDRDNDEILWEPGCTYQLEPVKIKNNGNLALKYKIDFNGFTGDSALLDVIDFTVSLGGTETNLGTFEGHLLPGAESGLLAISGHMQESAGNEYQDKQLTGAAITVIATQDTVEYDSFNNTYDQNAAYPELVGSASAFTAAISDPSVKEVKLTDDIAAPGVNVMSDINLNGQGNTITVSGTGSNCGIAAKSGVIENVIITGSGRGIGTGSSGTYGMDGDLVLNDVTIDGPTYAINIGKGNGHNLKATNSTILGWTSMDDVTATFTNCTFGKGTNGGAANYATFAIYDTTTFTNCTFNDGYSIFGRASSTGTITFNNCTHDGTAVTAANFATLFDTPHDSDFDYLMNQCEIYVDGVRVNP
jgi:predicted ribosomally synthesized peptide with SipW-like signal peptide